MSVEQLCITCKQGYMRRFLLSETEAIIKCSNTDCDGYLNYLPKEGLLATASSSHKRRGKHSRNSSRSSSPCVIVSPASSQDSSTDWEVARYLKTDQHGHAIHHHLPQELNQPAHNLAQFSQSCNVFGALHPAAARPIIGPRAVNNDVPAAGAIERGDSASFDIDMLLDSLSEQDPLMVPPSHIGSHSSSSQTLAFSEVSAPSFSVAPSLSNFVCNTIDSTNNSSEGRTIDSRSCSQVYKSSNSSASCDISTAREPTMLDENQFLSPAGSVVSEDSGYNDEMITSAVAVSEAGTRGGQASTKTTDSMSSTQQLLHTTTSQAAPLAQLVVPQTQVATTYLKVPDVPVSTATQKMGLDSECSQTPTSSALLATMHTGSCVDTEIHSQQPSASDQDFARVQMNELTYPQLRLTEFISILDISSDPSKLASSSIPSQTFCNIINPPDGKRHSFSSMINTEECSSSTSLKKSSDEDLLGCANNAPTESTIRPLNCSKNDEELEKGLGHFSNSSIESMNVDSVVLEKSSTNEENNKLLGVSGRPRKRQYKKRKKKQDVSSESDNSHVMESKGTIENFTDETQISSDIPSQDKSITQKTSCGKRKRSAVDSRNDSAPRKSSRKLNITVNSKDSQRTCTSTSTASSKWSSLPPAPSLLNVRPSLAALLPPLPQHSHKSSCPGGRNKRHKPSHPFRHLANAFADPWAFPVILLDQLDIEVVVQGRQVGSSASEKITVSTKATLDTEPEVNTVIDHSKVKCDLLEPVKCKENDQEMPNLNNISSGKQDEVGGCKVSNNSEIDDLEMNKTLVVDEREETEHPVMQSASGLDLPNSVLENSTVDGGSITTPATAVGSSSLELANDKLLQSSGADSKCPSGIGSQKVLSNARSKVVSRVYPRVGPVHQPVVAVAPFDHNTPLSSVSKQSLSCNTTSIEKENSKVPSLPDPKHDQLQQSQNADGLQPNMNLSKLQSLVDNQIPSRNTEQHLKNIPPHSQPNILSHDYVSIQSSLDPIIQPVLEQNIQPHPRQNNQVNVGQSIEPHLGQNILSRPLQSQNQSRPGQAIQPRPIPNVLPRPKHISNSQSQLSRNNELRPEHRIVSFESNSQVRVDHPLQPPAPLVQTQHSNLGQRNRYDQTASQNVPIMIGHSMQMQNRSDPQPSTILPVSQAQCAFQDAQTQPRQYVMLPQGQLCQIVQRPIGLQSQFVHIPSSATMLQNGQQPQQISFQTQPQIDVSRQFNNLQLTNQSNSLLPAHHSNTSQQLGQQQQQPTVFCQAGPHNQPCGTLSSTTQSSSVTYNSTCCSNDLMTVVSESSVGQRSVSKNTSPKPISSVKPIDMDIHVSKNSLSSFGNKRFQSSNFPETQNHLTCSIGKSPPLSPIAQNSLDIESSTSGIAFTPSVFPSCSIYSSVPSQSSSLSQSETLSSDLRLLSLSQKQHSYFESANLGAVPVHSSDMALSSNPPSPDSSPSSPRNFPLVGSSPNLSPTQLSNSVASPSTSSICCEQSRELSPSPNAFPSDSSPVKFIHRPSTTAPAHTCPPSSSPLRLSLSDDEPEPGIVPIEKRLVMEETPTSKLRSIRLHEMTDKTSRKEKTIVTNTNERNEIIHPVKESMDTSVTISSSPSSLHNGSSKLPVKSPSELIDSSASFSWTSQSPEMKLSTLKDKVQSSSLSTAEQILPKCELQNRIMPMETGSSVNPPSLIKERDDANLNLNNGYISLTDSVQTFNKSVMLDGQLNNTISVNYNNYEVAKRDELNYNIVTNSEHCKTTNSLNSPIVSASLVGSRGHAISDPYHGNPKFTISENSIITKDDLYLDTLSSYTPGAQASRRYETCSIDENISTTIVDIGVTNPPKSNSVVNNPVSNNSQNVFHMFALQAEEESISLSNTFQKESCTFDFSSLTKGDPTITSDLALAKSFEPNTGFLKKKSESIRVYRHKKVNINKLKDSSQPSVRKEPTREPKTQSSEKLSLPLHDLEYNQENKNLRKNHYVQDMFQEIPTSSTSITLPDMNVEFPKVTGVLRSLRITKDSDSKSIEKCFTTATSNCNSSHNSRKFNTSQKIQRQSSYVKKMPDTKSFSVADSSDNSSAFPKYTPKYSSESSDRYSGMKGQHRVFRTSEFNSHCSRATSSCSDSTKATTAEKLSVWERAREEARELKLRASVVLHPNEEVCQSKEKLTKAVTISSQSCTAVENSGNGKKVKDSSVAIDTLRKKRLQFSNLPYSVKQQKLSEESSNEARTGTNVMNCSDIAPGDITVVDSIPSNVIDDPNEKLKNSDDNGQQSNGISLPVQNSRLKKIKICGTEFFVTAHNSKESVEVPSSDHNVHSDSDELSSDEETSTNNLKLIELPNDDAAYEQLIASGYSVEKPEMKFPSGVKVIFGGNIKSRHIEKAGRASLGQLSGMKNESKEFRMKRKKIGSKKIANKEDSKLDPRKLAQDAVDDIVSSRPAEDIPAMVIVSVNGKLFMYGNN